MIYDSPSTRKTAHLDCATCPHSRRGVLGTCQFEQLALLSKGKSSQRYRKGQVIFSQDGHCQGLHCIFQGKVKITKVTGDGREQIIRLANSGDMLGVSALFGEETTHHTSAVALEDCVVCLIPRPDILGLVQSNAQFANALLQQLSLALNFADQRITAMAHKPVRERLAEALLLLQATYWQADTPEFTMAISREDLASLVGTAKETASRLLSELKEAGIIAAKGSNITILQARRLVQISTQYD